MTIKVWKPNSKVVNNLKRVIEIIKEEPKRLDMSDWARYIEGTWNSPPCGTVGCIAGWLSIMQNKAMGKPNLIHKIENRWQRAINAENTAIFRDVIAGMKLKGDERKAIPYLLFYSEHWPKDFRYKYKNFAYRERDIKHNAELTIKLLKLVIAKGIHYDCTYFDSYTWVQ